MYILALVWMFAFLLLSAFFLSLCCHFRPLKTLVIRFRQNFWNGLIRVLDVAYFPVCMTVAIQI